ncbi:hypothetical protein [Xanthomonas perforans]|uniref:hypothetical protein n=1 Tax=Xanthomonas perforans TaxID=442694 RepID=UPI0023588234|nr:hypothetical protein [Xanthomonas perforans]MDC9654370.1 hypothetical protein [Xanthomonas perforans]MEB2158948.1 hypothetical protein [Xanthomonas campestris pv. campestris]
MNNHNFAGNIVWLEYNEQKKFLRLKVAREDYAGMDGDTRRMKKTVLPFVAFDHTADYIQRNARVGCQLILVSKIENDDYDPGDGSPIRYGFTFKISEVTLGAPGKRRREEKAQQNEKTQP